jgi:hypothetical protein
MNMGSVDPVEKEFIVNKNIESVRNSILNRLGTMKGKIVISDDNYIECDFGSLLKARLLGEFFVSKETLPRKAEINLEDMNNSETKLRIFIKDTHQYGIKTGYIKKYEKALKNDLDLIIDSINETDIEV